MNGAVSPTRSAISHENHGEPHHVSPGYAPLVYNTIEKPWPCSLCSLFCSFQKILCNYPSPASVSLAHHYPHLPPYCLYQNLVAPSNCLRWPLTGREAMPGDACLGPHLFRLPELKVVASSVSEFDKASRLQPEVRVITYTTPCSPIVYFFGIPAWSDHRPRPLFS